MYVLPVPVLCATLASPPADRLCSCRIYTSSFFGDELWPSDSLGSTRTALVSAPSPVCIVYVRTHTSPAFTPCLQLLLECLTDSKSAALPCSTVSTLPACRCQERTRTST